MDLAGALEVVDAEPSRIGTPGNWDGMQTKRFPIVPSSVDLANILEVADAGACPAVSLAFLESEDKHGGPLILVRKEKDGRHRLRGQLVDVLKPATKSAYEGATSDVVSFSAARRRSQPWTHSKCR